MWVCAWEILKFVYQKGLTEGTSFTCSLTLNISSTRDAVIDLKWFLANEKPTNKVIRAVGSLLMVCIGRQKWKRKRSNPVKSSASQSLMLWGQIVVRLRQPLCCQKQGWRLRQVHRVHHILMEETEGQDVVVNILEAFVNRWRRAGKRYLTLSRRKRGEKKNGVESNI